jgi:hypothetical protein
METISSSAREKKEKRGRKKIIDTRTPRRQHATHKRIEEKRKKEVMRLVSV